MVSASTIVASNCAMVLRQCESLKSTIQGKSNEATNVLAEEFIARQKLETLYKSLLVTDLQYALDRKVELELWNFAFKGHIDSLRQNIKDRKTNDKNEVQAKLSLFLDASSGFYFELLQDFCDVYNLDIPYHGKASQFGMLSESKRKYSGPKPKFNACLYICQDCLVHLGDLARYRNDSPQAEVFYMLASRLLPGNGQPYNQLAILATSRNDLLQAVFYYCKSIAVHNQFPAAAANLHKTLSQICAKPNFNILAKSNGLSVPEFMELFLQFHGSIHLMQDLGKLTGLKGKLLQDAKDTLPEVTERQLVFMAGVCVFNLYKHKPRYESDEKECITEDESTVWQLLLSLSMGLLQLMLCHTNHALRTEQHSLEDVKYFPSIKVFLDWIFCNSAGLFEEEQLKGDAEFYMQLVQFGNELLKLCKERENSAAPLVEDWELHGFVSLRRSHKKYDFKMDSHSLTRKSACMIRASRTLSFLDWLTMQQIPSRFIAKSQPDHGSEYVFLPRQAGSEKSIVANAVSNKELDLAVQKLFDALPSYKNRSIEPRNKSPFSDARSLFRNDSGDRATLEAPSVQGPVHAYSLFDSVWGVNLPHSSSEGVSDMQMSSPILPLNMNLYPASSAPGLASNSIPAGDAQQIVSSATYLQAMMYQQAPHTATGLPSQQASKQNALLVMRQPTDMRSDDVSLAQRNGLAGVPGLGRGMFTSPGFDSEYSSLSPHHLLNSAPQSNHMKGFHQVSGQLPSQLMGLHLSASNGAIGSSASISSVGPSSIGDHHKASSLSQSQPTPPQQLSLHHAEPLRTAPQRLDQIQQQAMQAGLLPQRQQQTPSAMTMSIPSDGIGFMYNHQPIHFSPLVSGVFTPGIRQSPSFMQPTVDAAPGMPGGYGVIGQNNRNPSTLQPGVSQSSQLVSSGLLIDQQRPHQQPWSQPFAPSQGNGAGAGKSIWSSNYALGQGALSPLEQLLQDQRKQQRPK